jgi:hypothetical protein
MAGFDRDAARSALGLPDGIDPIAMAAIGYAGDPAALPENYQKAETAPRARKPLAEFVFGEGWNQPMAGI